MIPGDYQEYQAINGPPAPRTPRPSGPQALGPSGPQALRTPRTHSPQGVTPPNYPTRHEPIRHAVP